MLTIVGPKADEDRIPGIDVALADGDTWGFGGLTMHVMDTPGHTRGHITLWFPEADALFPGAPGPGTNCLGLSCKVPLLTASCRTCHWMLVYGIQRGTVSRQRIWSLAEGCRVCGLVLDLNLIQWVMFLITGVHR